MRPKALRRNKHRVGRASWRKDMWGRCVEGRGGIAGQEVQAGEEPRGELPAGRDGRM